MSTLKLHMPCFAQSNESYTDFENWNGMDRFHFNANITDQDLVEVIKIIDIIIIMLTESIMIPQYADIFTCI